jgi:glycerol uptake facilitator-like aquaporin
MSHTLCVALVVAFLYGTVVLSRDDLGIPCEMVVYFCYYRLSVTIGLWFGQLLNSFVEMLMLIAGARAAASAESSGDSSSSQASHYVAAMLVWLHNLLETMCCSLILNAGMWLACQVFWYEVEGINVEYLPGFVVDVFGACAAGGYARARGFECLPIFG